MERSDPDIWIAVSVLILTMLNWIRRFRRRRFKNSPLPEPWQKILARNAPFRSRMDSSTQDAFDQSIAIFVAEKNWEGCGGLVIQDEHRLTIAAHAMRLTLGFREDYFDDVMSILVYPTAYEAPAQHPLSSGVVIEGPSARLGEAWFRGPIVLAWEDILHSVQHPGAGHNVVVHEFSHVLDMRNGRYADGVPVIESKAEADEWLNITKHEFEQLCHRCRAGKLTLLDCYGTTSMAEFFAVTSEAFFELPHQFATDHPALFRLLRRFYRQDPALSTTIEVTIDE